MRKGQIINSSTAGRLFGAVFLSVASSVPASVLGQNGNESAAFVAEVVQMPCPKPGGPTQVELPPGQTLSAVSEGYYAAGQQVVLANNSLTREVSAASTTSNVTGRRLTRVQERLEETVRTNVLLAAENYASWLVAQYDMASQIDTGLPADGSGSGHPTDPFATAVSRFESDTASMQNAPGAATTLQPLRARARTCVASLMEDVLVANSEALSGRLTIARTEGDVNAIIETARLRQSNGATATQLMTVANGRLQAFEAERREIAERGQREAAEADARWMREVGEPNLQVVRRLSAAMRGNDRRTAGSLMTEGITVTNQNGATTRGKEAVLNEIVGKPMRAGVTVGQPELYNRRVIIRISAGMGGNFTASYEIQGGLVSSIVTR